MGGVAKGILGARRSLGMSASSPEHSARCFRSKERVREIHVAQVAVTFVVASACSNTRTRRFR
jgi:hypothetical protein